MQIENVHGPYMHGQRWRIAIVAAEGGRRETRYESFEKECDARKARQKIERKIAAMGDAEKLRRQAEQLQEQADRLVAQAEQRAGRGMTVGQAITKYEGYLLDVKGNKRGSVTTTLHRLRAFFGDRDLSLSEITARRGAELYTARCKKTRTDTHRNELAECKTFLGWCVEQAWMRQNPLGKVKPIGKRRRGKAQLRITETRRLVERALHEASWSDEEARTRNQRFNREGSLAVMVALYLGLRAGEVVQIERRDLDDDGRLLWIPDSKTEAGKRTLKVPVAIRALLQVQAERAAGERIFPYDRNWVRKNVKRLCKRLGIPAITAHGLRGTHATLAMEIGITADAIALALGHANTKVTRDHYIAGGAVEVAAQERVNGLLHVTEAPSSLETGNPKCVSKAEKPAPNVRSDRLFFNNSAEFLWS